MNIFARFDKNPAMTLQNIKETKRYGQMHGRTDGQHENSIPTTNKVCGGGKITICLLFNALFIRRFKLICTARVIDCKYRAQ